MSFEDTIISVTITATSATPTVANLETPAILAHVPSGVTALVSTYYDTAGMVSDGFSATGPAVLMATAICSQDPRPAQFKVIKAATKVAQTFTFQATDNTEGHVVGLTLLSPAGVSYPCYYTVESGKTTTNVASSVSALIDALADIASTPTTDTVTASAGTTGTLWYPSLVMGGKVADTTPTATPNTDLDAAILVDSDWYGVSGMWLDPTNIGLIATWVEANKKLHAATTYDTANLTSSSGTAYARKTAGQKRSYTQYSGTPSQYGALALMAQRLTAQPGTDTWAFKQLANVTIDNLSPSDTTALQANNCGFYMNIGGVNCTYEGKSGHGQYMDLTRLVDAIGYDVQLRIMTRLVTTPKAPYDAKGIAAIGGDVMASLQSFVGTGALSNDSGFEPQVSTPDIKTVSTSDKQNRILKNVKFNCYATGAMHKFQIAGVVNI